MKFIIVKGAQINAVALAAALDQTENSREEVEAGFGLVREKFDVAEMGDVVDRFGLHTFSFPAGR